MTPFQRFVFSMAAFGSDPAFVIRSGPFAYAGPGPHAPRVAPPDLARELDELDADGALDELGRDVLPDGPMLAAPRLERPRPYRPNRTAQRAEKRRRGRFG